VYVDFIDQLKFQKNTKNNQENRATDFIQLFLPFSVDVSQIVLLQESNDWRGRVGYMFIIYWLQACPISSVLNLLQMIEMCMGARRIFFSGVGNLGDLETKVSQWGPEVEPRWGPGGKSISKNCENDA